MRSNLPIALERVYLQDKRGFATYADIHKTCCICRHMLTSPTVTVRFDMLPNIDLLCERHRGCLQEWLDNRHKLKPKE